MTGRLPEDAQSRVLLQAGANTIRIFNTEDSAPDLDRISIG
jgi:hypothetical protein